MSTSETSEFAIGECPCGKGAINKRVTSQDNPWSSVDIDYAIACSKCTHEWTISSSGMLTNKASERPYLEARRVERGASDKVRVIVDELVDRYFEDFGAKTMVAELREMQRLGIATMSIVQFRKATNEGHPPSRRSYGLRNRSWLLGLAQTAGKKPALELALAHLDKANNEMMAAGKAVIHRSATK